MTTACASTAITERIYIHMLPSDLPDMSFLDKNPGPVTRLTP
jgi:hypothetical protein